ncbi:hypothetical protein BaRGS_00012621 [Batillaria attramentaria]|uniref:Uncharacterized protein n=1 Tax=Batillaria attramentaria TaxID=370345 RepID=A0ABD0L9H1_9CAEN
MCQEWSGWDGGGSTITVSLGLSDTSGGKAAASGSNQADVFMSGNLPCKYCQWTELSDNSPRMLNNALSLFTPVSSLDVTTVCRASVGSFGKVGCREKSTAYWGINAVHLIEKFTF